MSSFGNGASCSRNLTSAGDYGDCFGLLLWQQVDYSSVAVAAAAVGAVLLCANVDVAAC